MTAPRFLFLALAVICSACSPTPSATACGPTNCQGCCNGDLCVANPSETACGLEGNACDVCVNGQTCQAGKCAFGGAGGGSGGGSAAGGGSGGGTGGGAACVPETDAALCTRTGRVCGGAYVPDNCGVSRSVMNCGSCTAPQTCQPSGVCACVETDAEFCVRAGKQCGPANGTDTCGVPRTVPNCGACTAPKTCDGAQQCTCAPETDAQFCTRSGKACGAVTANDNCGTPRTVASCGTCAGTNVCTAGTCACPETNSQFCQRLGATCGPLSGMDSCGNPKSVGSCGLCTAPQTCGGAGAMNQCGCAPQTDAAFCTAQAKNCGMVTATDNCAVARTVDCGTCTAPLTCGGGTSTNVCGCTTESNTAFCARLGKNCGTVTAPDNCGASRTTSCGSTFCTNPLQTCGGGGVLNVCGCPGETDAQFCTRLGKTCGSFTANDVCGVSRTATCGSCGGFQTCLATNVCGGRVEPVTPVCGGGFCWENPSPVGVALRAVKTSPTGHNWSVGDSGTVLHWNGTTWAGWFALVNTALRAVWAFSDTDVWVAGDAGVVLHYDGATWTPVASGVAVALNGMWGAADGTLWIVGSGGTVLKRPPSGTLAVQTVPGGASTLNNVFGIGSDVWVVGSTILRFNGTAWSQFTASTTLYDVWGASTTDVWAVGYSSVMRFNGTTWATSNSAAGYGIFGFGANNVWVTGSSRNAYRFDGLAWTQSNIEPSGFSSPLYAITGSATDNTLLAVGEYGTLYRYTPTGGWFRQSRGVHRTSPTMSVNLRTFATAGGEVYAVGDADFYPSSSFNNRGIFLRKSAGTWVLENGATQRNLVGCSATATNNVWAVDYAAAWRFNGTSWTSYTIPSFSGEAVAALSATDAWVVGDDKTLRFNGTSFAAVPNPISTTTVNLYAVAAADSSHVWAGGSGGNMLFFDGSAWASQPSGVANTQTISGIRMLSTTHGLAWGTFGLSRWNGTAWSSVSVGQVNHAYPESTTTYWVAASNQLSRWDGTQLVDMAPWRVGATLGFADVVGDGTNVWVLGGSGEILKKQ